MIHSIISMLIISFSNSLLHENLTISSGNDIHCFDCLVATTEQESYHGLMFRRSLPKNKGMLFPFKQAQKLTFWMKNTFIPLDMIFIDSQGKITNIEKNCTPQTLDARSCISMCQAVFEVNGGLCDELNILEGDEISSPTLSTYGICSKKVQRIEL
ncbi:putative exported protein [Monocercomonoides exilis]|uniref:putative exported protein n=1 Tax=Monocercomonoides exilis TaxID=2049356 RepID=UPI00355A51E5|nr:putative exported protein [Monocercomonoides exilis]